MEELKKKIAGDWFDVREAMDNPDSLERLLGVTGPLLQKTAADIRLSVDEGIVEFKRGRILAVYNFIESFKYDSRGFEELKGLGDDTTALLFVVLMQRLFATGEIRRKQKENLKGDQAELVVQDGESASTLKITEIVAAINERIKKDPSFARRPEVKNILLQVKIYQKELAKFKELRPNIPPEKAQGFIENFKRTFAEITKKIQGNYAAIIASEEKEARKASPKDVLEKHDLSVLGPLLLTQAKEISSIRSTLLFAERERYKTRDILSEISGLKGSMLALFSQEMKSYATLEPFENGARMLSRTLGEEVVRIIEREIEWLALNVK